MMAGDFNRDCRCWAALMIKVHGRVERVATEVGRTGAISIRLCTFQLWVMEDPSPWCADLVEEKILAQIKPWNHGSWTGWISDG